MKYKRLAAAIVAGGMPLGIIAILQRIHGEDNREMLRPALVAVMGPIIIGLRRFTAPSENAWYTPRVWAQIMLLTVLYALSGVFLHMGAGLTGSALVAGLLVCTLIQGALVMYVGHRIYRRSIRDSSAFTQRPAPPP